MTTAREEGEKGKGATLEAPGEEEGDDGVIGLFGEEGNDDVFLLLMMP